MNLSLGELQALVAKAARGAGRSHGMAEEAARAARWLVERGQDGVGAVAELLAQTDGRVHGALCPDWPAMTRADGPVCGLVLGTLLSDLGEVPEGSGGPVLSPVLLLPFLADVARAQGAAVAVWIGEARVVVGPDGAVSGGIAPVERADVRIAMAAEAPAAATALASRAICDAAVLDRLTALAQRTYAPATDESRARGAGAGLIDSD